MYSNFNKTIFKNNGQELIDGKLFLNQCLWLALQSYFVNNNKSEITSTVLRAIACINPTNNIFDNNNIQNQEGLEKICKTLRICMVFHSHDNEKHVPIDYIYKIGNTNHEKIHIIVKNNHFENFTINNSKIHDEYVPDFPTNDIGSIKKENRINELLNIISEINNKKKQNLLLIEKIEVLENNKKELENINNNNSNELLEYGQLLFTTGDDNYCEFISNQISVLYGIEQSNKFLINEIEIEIENLNKEINNNNFNTETYEKCEKEFNDLMI